MQFSSVKTLQQPRFYQGKQVSRQSFQVKAQQKDKVNKIDKAEIAAIIGSGLTLTASQAQALTVDDSVNSLVGVIQQGGDIVKAGGVYVEKGFDIAKEGFGIAEPYLRQFADVAAPVVKQGINITSDVLRTYVIPAVQQAIPVVQDSVRNFAEAQGLRTSGIQQGLTTVEGKLTEASYNAQPLLQKFLSFVGTSAPVTLAEYAAALVALYYIAPPVLNTLFSFVRGYAGNVAPAAVLDTVQKDSNSYIVDIRATNEKERSGIPDLPSGFGGKLIENDFANIDNGKVRRQLKSPDKIEIDVTALQISQLKKVGRGTTIFLLDRYGKTSKEVAKALTKRGYGRVYVVNGGFDGGSGWSQSKLSINRRQVYSPEVLGVFGGNRKALPGS